MEFQIVEVYKGRYEFINLTHDYDENEEIAVRSFIRKVKHEKECEAVEVIFEKCFVLCKASDKSILLIGNLTQKSKDYIKTQLS